ncbi:MAG TPA: hypothetical protein VHF01_06715 [Candidatus Acidoferrum sp.]|nr:hypothetical protein [Candidatus Acidoferrum sp.]
MRTIAYYLATAALLLLGGYAYLRRMAVENDGTTISQAITLSGVRRQMLHIADAEREYITLNDGCVSLDELIDEGKLEKGYDKRAGASGIAPPLSGPRGRPRYESPKTEVVASPPSL